MSEVAVPDPKPAMAEDGEALGAEAAPSAPEVSSPPPAKDSGAEVSIWSRIQSSGVLIPPDVIDKLAELDLELSEGRN